MGRLGALDPQEFQDLLALLESRVKQGLQEAMEQRVQMDLPDLLAKLVPMALLDLQASQESLVLKERQERLAQLESLEAKVTRGLKEIQDRLDKQARQVMAALQEELARQVLKVIQGLRDRVVRQAKLEVREALGRLGLLELARPETMDRPDLQATKAEQARPGPETPGLLGLQATEELPESQDPLVPLEQVKVVPLDQRETKVIRVKPERLDLLEKRELGSQALLVMQGKRARKATLVRKTKREPGKPDLPEAKA